MSGTWFKVAVYIDTKCLLNALISLLFLPKVVAAFFEQAMSNTNHFLYL